MKFTFNKQKPSIFFSYFVSVMVSILMLAISASLSTFLPEHNQYLLAAAAVAVSAWYAGSKQALLAAVLCVLVVNYFLIAPAFTFKLTPTIAADALVFLCVALLVIWIEEHRKRATLELREARDELRIILNGVTDGITVQAENGQVIYANEAASALLGYNEPEALVRSTAESRATRFSFLDDSGGIVPIEQRPRAQVFRSGKPATMSFQIRLVESGEERWINLKSAPVFNERSHAKIAVNILQDITAQKTRELEQARFHQQAEFHHRRIDRLIRHVPAMVFEGVLELDSGIQRLDFVSSYTAEMLGYAPEEMRGSPLLLSTLIHPDDREALENSITEQLSHGDKVQLIFRAIRKDGEVIHCEAQFTLTRDGNGTPISTAGVVRDITERVRYEEHLKEAADNLMRSNEELEQFAYIASHDLQEPLRMVTSYLQLIEQRYGDKLDDDGHEFIHYAVDGAKRMKNLINDLLLYSRFQRTKTVFEPFAMDEALSQALGNLQLAIKDSGAVITHDALPEITANEGQMVQLWQNLLANAIKFRGDEPVKIHVSARREQKHWVFSVQDNGIGIDPRHSERIFLIFQRLHSREAHTGTGIGLAICRKIVERHHGRIWVDSSSGAGATFYFSLPVSLRKVS